MSTKHLNVVNYKLKNSKSFYKKISKPREELNYAQQINWYQQVEPMILCTTDSYKAGISLFEEDNKASEHSSNLPTMRSESTRKNFNWVLLKTYWTIVLEHTIRLVNSPDARTFTPPVAPSEFYAVQPSGVDPERRTGARHALRVPHVRHVCVGEVQLHVEHPPGVLKDHHGHYVDCYVPDCHVQRWRSDTLTNWVDRR